MHGTINIKYEFFVLLLYSYAYSEHLHYFINHNFFFQIQQSDI